MTTGRAVVALLFMCLAAASVSLEAAFIFAFAAAGLVVLPVRDEA